MAKKNEITIVDEAQVVVQENNAIIDEETIKNYFCKKILSRQLFVNFLKVVRLTIKSQEKF